MIDRNFFVHIGVTQHTGKLVFGDFRTRCVATVGADIIRPKTYLLLSVSDKRKHFR